MIPYLGTKRTHGLFTYLEIQVGLVPNEGYNDKRRLAHKS